MVTVMFPVAHVLSFKNSRVSDDDIISCIIHVNIQPTTEVSPCLKKNAKMKKNSKTGRCTCICSAQGVHVKHFPGNMSSQVPVSSVCCVCICLWPWPLPIPKQSWVKARIWVPALQPPPFCLSYSNIILSLSVLVSGEEGTFIHTQLWEGLHSQWGTFTRHLEAKLWAGQIKIHKWD